MPSFTVQELVDRATAAADMHDSFVTPAQWLAWAKVEADALDLYCARHGWTTRGLTAYSTNTALDPNQVTLADEVLAVVGVWEVNSTRMRRLIHRPYVDSMTHTLASMSTNTGRSTHYSITHKSSGVPQVLLWPYPTSSYTYTVYALTSQISSATTLASALVYPAGIEERVVLGMARRALSKEDTSTSAVDRQIATAEAHVEDLCWSRALAEAPKVRNVDAVERGWSIPPSSEWVLA